MASISTITLPNGSQYDFKDADARAQLPNKVDKVSGKGLSTEDFTSEEKTKLAGIATGATANVGTVTSVRVQATAPITSSTSTAQTSTLNTTIGINAASQSAAGSMSAEDKTKIDKISVGSVTTSAQLGDTATTALAIWGNSTNKVAISATNSSSGDGHRYAIRAQSDGIQLWDYTDGAAEYKIYPTSGTSPISVSSGAISHANSGVTAGTYPAGAHTSTAQTPAFGDGFVVPSFKVNATGHVTEALAHNVIIPDNAATSSTKGLMSAADKDKLDKFSTNLADVSVGSVKTTASNISFWRGFDDSTYGDYFAMGSQSTDGSDGFRIYVGEKRLSFRTYVGSTAGAYAWSIYPPSFYQTNNSANTSLSSGTITRVVLTTTNKISEGSGFSVASGGIKVANAGTYRVSGSIYINSASGQTSRGAYIYVGTSTTMSNNTQVCEALYAGAASGAIAIAPKMITVAANQIVFLAARSQGAASSVPASQVGTYLLVERVA